MPLVMFDTEIAKTLNNNFSNSVKEFDIKVTGDLPCGVSNTENLVERVIEKYKIHQSHDRKIKGRSGDNTISLLSTWFL